VISLRGKNALVTGGSRGIGRATVLALAGAGADVGLTYHTKRNEAEELVRQIRGLGRRAFAAGGDLADPETVERIVREYRAGFGHLDILVANAGIWPVDAVPLADLPAARWRGTLAANLDSVILTLQATLPMMRPGGAVVIISSTAAQRGEAGHADYAASKGALVSLTKSLAVEYAPAIRVNSVAPGWVDTDMSASALRGPDRGRVVSTIPLGRPATAEDIAGPIVFLASDLAQSITGEILNVNGGSVLCG
jgi:3-oxoacyl-[acyl-carrier protein] reductase